MTHARVGRRRPTGQTLRRRPAVGSTGYSAGETTTLPGLRRRDSTRPSVRTPRNDCAPVTSSPRLVARQRVVDRREAPPASQAPRACEARYLSTAYDPRWAPPIRQNAPVRWCLAP